MENDVDLVVLGGGPAGVHAAITAAAHGLRVALVDQNHAAGGQVMRPMPDTFSMPAGLAATREGDALRLDLARSPVRTFFSHTVWNVSSALRVDAVGPGGPVHWQCRALVVASGTTERVVPFPGWTLPNVMGLAAATILLKSQKMLPGKNTLIAGCGPLLAAVAAGIVEGGGRIAALVDAAPRSAWIKTSPAMASRPDLMWQGVKWLAQIKSSGAPMYSGHAIEKVETAEEGLRVVLAPVDGERRIAAGERRVVHADTVVVGNGLVPGTDVTRMLRARHAFDRKLGGWVVETDANCRTSFAGLYAAGDGCGISGAAAAAQHGVLAGLSVARDLGRLDGAAFEHAALPVRRRLGKAARFGRAMGSLMALPRGQVETIAPDAVVCRCEDVTRAEIDAAVSEGARDMNQLKAWTRCGMGPCQGRTCGDVAAELAALRAGCDRERIGYFTGRAPLRPVSLEQLTGDYGYADIPIPKAAPL